MAKKSTEKVATKIAAMAAGGATARVVGKYILPKVAPSLNPKVCNIGKLVLGVGIAMSTKDENLQCFGGGMAADSLISTVNNFTGGAIGDVGFRTRYRLGAYNSAQVRQIIQQKKQAQQGSMRNAYVGKSSYRP